MKIIVLGAGLVPRVGGIAPIRKPFEASENLVKLILGHGSLKPYKVNEDGSKSEITFKNYKLLFVQEKAAATPIKNAAGPFVKEAPVKTAPLKAEAPKAAPTVKVVEKPVEQKVEKKEEKPVESNTIVLDDIEKDTKKDWKNNKTFKPIQNPEKKED